MANKKNLANGVIQAPGIDDTDTSLDVGTGEGTRFPATPFFATITPLGVLSTVDNSEVVSVTNVTSDTLTITRAQKSTTAKSFVAGSIISNGIYVEDITEKVTGAGTVTDDLPAVFDGTTGYLIKQKTYAAFKTLLALVKGDVGLGNVDNTSDSTKNSASASLTNKDLTGSGNTFPAFIKTVKVQKFAASGTYTPSTGMVYCIIETWGGGGGGGNCFATNAANIYASGGGAGGYSKKYATAADIGASKTVTIGAGGAGNASGSTSTGNTALGGDTSVGTLCVSKGGGNGGYAQHGVQVSAVGLGGSTTGAAGDITAPGAVGGWGLYGGNATPQASSGSGGVTVLGGAGAGQVNADGAAGTANTGSGGSGGAQYSGSNTARAGGAGASGYVVVTEFCTQ